MQIREFRKLTASERFTIDTLIECTDGSVSFALIGERAVLTLSGVDPSDETEAVRAEIERAAAETLSGMPDLSTLVLSNGYGLVNVFRAGILSQGILSETERSSGKINPGTAMTLQDKVLSLCERPELIAAAFAD